VNRLEILEYDILLLLLLLLLLTLCMVLCCFQRRSIFYISSLFDFFYFFFTRYSFLLASWQPFVHVSTLILGLHTETTGVHLFSSPPLGAPHYPTLHFSPTPRCLPIINTFGDGIIILFLSVRRIQNAYIVYASHCMHTHKYSCSQT